eukprot:1781134-Rhodomonas_salina.2
MMIPLASFATLLELNLALRSDDLITDQYPVFVKFYEKWCSRCLAMKKAYENAASRMVGRVIFMEVAPPLSCHAFSMRGLALRLPIMAPGGVFLFRHSAGVLLDAQS